LSETAKRLTLLLLATILSTGAAFAAAPACHSLKSKKDRDACHARQAAARQVGSEAPDGKMIDPIEQMKIDDDRLARRLQGICRGC
jgi:hypothetical protein